MFPTPALACFIQYLFVDVAVSSVCHGYVYLGAQILLTTSGKFPATGTMERLELGVHVHGVIVE